MNKIEINGHKATDFGTNNYSCGMRAIIFNPNEVTIEEVKELPGVFLHPTVRPNSLEIFALLGTDEQFIEFYNSAVESHCSKQAFRELGNPTDKEGWKKLSNHVDELKSSFIPWY